MLVSKDAGEQRHLSLQDLPEIRRKWQEALEYYSNDIPSRCFVDPFTGCQTQPVTLSLVGRSKAGLEKEIGQLFEMRERLHILELQLVSRIVTRVNCSDESFLLIAATSRAV